jgi:NAD(P)-dependent dehydrogenase (short-subunit alcohol dehydrogenase family)
MTKTAVVTGAGSGVGRAAALALAREGWNVAVVGRRRTPLDETIKLAKPAGGQMLAIECDVADADAVERAAREIQQKLGDSQALVAAAGINIPNRSWEVLSPQDYQRVIDTNLNGTFYWARALLPGMRRLGAGTIVGIVSDAGLAASAKAGAAYVASKFAQRGLIQSINAEERHRGIRAAAILPGDIDTPLLDKRPTPPPPEARAKMLQSEDLAACIMLAINLPQRAIVEELLIRPR